MLQPETRYTKLRWFFTIFGLSLYVLDIATDVRLVVKYFMEGEILWMGLTLSFILAGLLVTQTFSYAWYADDLREGVLDAEEKKAAIPGGSKRELVLHLFGVGIFMRFGSMLTLGYRVLWTKPASREEKEEMRSEHRKLFHMATDLSMLKLFESLLESAPQLLLQLYIVMDRQDGSPMQYLSIAFSFLNIAWALVDYRRCLRISLPHAREMAWGLPTAVYLLYKVCTITTHILSYCLLFLLSSYTAVGLAVAWLLATAWAHLLRTNFCTSWGLEFLYRGVVGVILMFTFFNVKGQDTGEAMVVYYFFYSSVNFTAPALLYLLKPETLSLEALLSLGFAITSATFLGLVCLVLYYLLLHEREKPVYADEVDGLSKKPKATSRMMNFLQP
ncbi:XK-related protein 9 [Nelusetta ayraudi]|uniref:XK-related protein 9 n=1 Tax=Nelusetta ayraudi TaxID=303726 RepID=UPI003F718582